MSHSKERAEKVCLNCDAALIDRYCHKCGQENVEPQQNLWHLIVHFFNDFTHFDGKFFSTVKLLMFKPGFLSLEYMHGRRAKYLDPIRMYIFTSAVAFLVIFSLGNTSDNVVLQEKQDGQRRTTTVRPSKESTLGSVAEKLEQPTVLRHKEKEFEPQNVAQYDSLQRVLPKQERDGWFGQYISRKTLQIGEAYEKKGNAIFTDKLNEFLHSFPQIFFISLPLFALTLYLLQIRRRKQYYFVSHAIFSIHYYCAAFIFLIVSILLDRIPYSAWISAAVGIILPPIYLFIAMRKFYAQGKWKTMLKFVILTIISFVTILLLFIIYFLYYLIAVTADA